MSCCLNPSAPTSVLLIEKLTYIFQQHVDSQRFDWLKYLLEDAILCLKSLSETHSLCKLHDERSITKRKIHNSDVICTG